VGHMTRALVLTCLLALSSVGSGAAKAKAEAPIANTSRPISTSSSASFKQQQGGDQLDHNAGGSAGLSSTTHQAPGVSKTPKTAEQNTSAESKAFYIMTSEVVGRKVRGPSRSGAFIGRLVSLIVNTSTGNVPYVVIDYGGFLGVDTTQVVVPFQLIDFTDQWGFPILKIGDSKLKGAPKISDRDVEALLHDQNWIRSVDDYYGVVAGAKTIASATIKPAKTVSAQSANGAAVAHGEQIAHTVCAVCHTFNKGGGTLVGPNLYGVVGRPIASVAGYDYSSALKRHHGDWSQAKLEAWLKKPSAFAPGTKMTFAGFPSDKKRHDVIDYLKTLSDRAAAKH